MGKFFNSIKNVFKSDLKQTNEAAKILRTPNHDELMRRYANNSKFTQMDYDKRMLAKNKVNPVA